MVVVPKKIGQLRICVDLKPISESVIREFHPFSTVDETLGQLTGAAVFSKFDQREHDTRLYTVLQRLEKAGVKLNPVK